MGNYELEKINFKESYIRNTVTTEYTLYSDWLNSIETGDYISAWTKCKKAEWMIAWLSVNTYSSKDKALNYFLVVDDIMMRSAKLLANRSLIGVYERLVPFYGYLALHMPPYNNIVMPFTLIELDNLYYNNIGERTFIDALKALLRLVSTPTPTNSKDMIFTLYSSLKVIILYVLNVGGEEVESEYSDEIRRLIPDPKRYDMRNNPREMQALT